MTANKELILALESLHKRILQSRFAEEVTETEVLGLVEAVSLINQQQAEIERLSKVRCHFPNDNYCKVVEVNEENEILKEENKQLIFDLKNAKAEVIQEVVERLKQVSKWLPLAAITDSFVTVSDINNIAKELVEEK